MSQLNAQFVRQGFWVDNPRGSIMGQTITTTTKNGNLIIALMAVLTTLGTNHFWSLVVFGYHQMRVNTSPRDGLFVQQQALMRTLLGPFAMLTDWLKLWWVWRRRVNRALIRCVSLVLLASIFAALTIVVGVFSSYLADGTNITVLVQSPYCGPVDYLRDDVEGSKVNSSIWSNEYIRKTAELAEAYTRDCYVNRTAVPERCRIFTRPTLPFQQQRVACPFEPSMCKNISEPGLAMDTGVLDLDDYFGFNLAASAKVKFRRKTTCAVLELDGHYEVLNTSDISDFKQTSGRAPWVGERAMRMYLGPTGGSNYTYSVQHMPEERENLAKVHLAFDYPSPYWKKIGGTFNPIPALHNDKSDLVVVFVVTRGTRWTTEVNDPLYSAHKVWKQRMTDNSTKISYTPDSPAAAFGCQYQYQFCYSRNSQSDNCTDLGGLPTSWDFPGANGIQQALLKLLVRIAYLNSAETGADHLTPSTLDSGFNQQLPDDQWVNDVVSLEKNIGAQMQIALSTYAIGLSTLDLSKMPPMQKNPTEADKQLCGLQRMQSPGGFVNINVFAFAFVITFCVTVITLDLVLLKILIFWHRFRGLLAPRIDAWVEDGIFQLQRRAYEAYGQGTWERPDKEVPITTDDADLAPFNLKSKPYCKCAHSSSIGENPSSTTTSVASAPDSSEEMRTIGLGTTFQKEHVEISRPTSDPSTPEAK